MIRASRAAVLVLFLAASCSSSGGDATPATTRPPLPAPTTSLTTTEPAVTATTVADPAACPAFLPARVVGTVANDALTEASGIALGRTNSDVLWMHNDSGDGARLFAVGQAGEDLGEFVLDGVEPFDAEDIAAGPGPDPGVSYLYLADIGDNLDTRPDVSVYRVPEPTVAGPGRTVVAGAERIVLRYPDGPRNAETLFVDPADGSLYVVARQTGEVFRAGGSDPDETMELVATLALGADGLATGGDVSADGGRIVIRTYFGVSVWDRQPGTTIAEALAGAPCPGRVAIEPQGEAIAFTADGAGYFTVSEGANPDLHLVAPG